jgi:hypothetical protein
MSLLDKFRPEDQESRLLFPGLGAFAIALLGGGVAVVGDWLSAQWAVRAGAVILVIGIVGGFLFIIWGFITAPREIMRNLRAFRERERSKWRRDDWKP